MSRETVGDGAWEPACDVHDARAAARPLRTQRATTILRLHELFTSPVTSRSSCRARRRNSAASSSITLVERSLTVELVPHRPARVVERVELIVHVANAGGQWDDDDLALDLPRDDVVARSIDLVARAPLPDPRDPLLPVLDLPGALALVKQTEVARLRVGHVAQILYRRVEGAVLGPRLRRTLFAKALEEAACAASQVLGIRSARRSRSRGKKSVRASRSAPSRMPSPSRRSTTVPDARSGRQACAAP